MPSERSVGSSRIARSAVQSGVEATRIPESDEVMSFWPSPMRTKGTATWVAARKTIRPTLAPGTRSTPRYQANGTRNAAPSATRAHATTDGAHVADPDLDEEKARAPDRADDEDEDP